MAKPKARAKKKVKKVVVDGIAHVQILRVPAPPPDAHPSDQQIDPAAHPPQAVVGVPTLCSELGFSDTTEQSRGPSGIIDRR